MLRCLLRRVIWLMLVILAVSLLTFVLMHQIPGGPFDREKTLPAAIIANLEATYNLNAPLHEQYLLYVSEAFLPRIRTDAELRATNTDYLINIPLPGDTALRWMNFGPSYASRRIDNLMMRFVDVMYAFPTILLIILIMAYFRAGIGNEGDHLIVSVLNTIDRDSGGVLFIFIGIGLTSWMGTARMVRAQVLSLRERDYVFAAISIGAPRHPLPSYPTQDPGSDHRLRNAVHPRLHQLRGVPQLHRAGRQPPDTQLGQHDRRWLARPDHLSEIRRSSPRWRRSS